MIGLSAKRFASQLSELQTLNPNGVFIFMEAQLRLLKEVDRVCKMLKEKESHRDRRRA
jgi:hypothetical protein